MLDPKVSELADRMIHVEFREREKQLRREIDLAVSALSLRGLVHSGAVVQKTYDLCAHDMETRALIIWQTLVNVLSDLGIEPSETLAVDLKDELLKHATAIYSYP